jgi:hypothetical protein
MRYTIENGKIVKSSLQNKYWLYEKVNDELVLRAAQEALEGVQRYFKPGHWLFYSENGINFAAGEIRSDLTYVLHYHSLNRRLVLPKSEWMLLDSIDDSTIHSI